MFEIVSSLGILYSESRTLGVKLYKEIVSKHEDFLFNFIIILKLLILLIANHINSISEDEC